MWLWKYICHYQIQIAISASKREYCTQFQKGTRSNSSSSTHCVRKSFLKINISYHLKSSGMCACQVVGNIRFFRKFCARTKRSQVNNEKKMTKKWKEKTKKTSTIVSKSLTVLIMNYFKAIFNNYCLTRIYAEAIAL